MEPYGGGSGTSVEDKSKRTQRVPFPLAGGSFLCQSVGYIENGAEFFPLSLLIDGDIACGGIVGDPQIFQRERVPGGDGILGYLERVGINKLLRGGGRGGFFFRSEGFPQTKERKSKKDTPKKLFFSKYGTQHGMKHEKTSCFLAGVFCMTYALGRQVSGVACYISFSGELWGELAFFCPRKPRLR
jgi:hypothetical protein